MPLDDDKIKDLEDKSSASTLENEHGDDFSAAEKSEMDKLGKSVGEEGGFYKKGKASLQGKRSAWKQRKAAIILAGVTVPVLGALLGLFSFLLPFKAEHIIQTIEQRVGQVPQNAVDRRLEYYMNRFLIISALEAANARGDRTVDMSDKDTRYTYLGGGVMSTLYTNWKGAKLDVKFREMGFELQPRLNNGDLIGNQYKSPRSWRLVDLNAAQGSPTRERDLGSQEARQLVREFANDQTRSHQILKRYHTRKILKKYYGINNWKPFEQTRNDARDKYETKKLKFKQALVRQTVGPISTRYANYLDCLLKGESECKKLKDPVPAINGDPDVDREAGDIDPADEEADKKLAQKIQDIGLKRILSYIAGPASVAFVVNAMAQLVLSVESGSVNRVIADKNSQQYAAYGTFVASAADQVKSGDDFDAEDPRILAELFDGFEQSPVYQQGTTVTGGVSAAGETVYRDCDGDGDKEALEPGETVCPNKRLIQDRTTFTNSPGWEVLVSISKVTVGLLGSIIAALESGLAAVASILRIDDAIAKIMDISGASKALSGAFGAILNRFAGPVITGTEVGPDAFDAVFASVAVRQSSLGGSVGQNREDTIGGKHLTDEQVAEINADNYRQRQYYLAQQPLMKRYFSPEITESMTSQLAMYMPTSLTSTSNKVATTLSPTSVASSFGNLFKKPVYADGSSNPFHALNYGYPVNDDIFTANEGDGLDPEEVRTKYQCDKDAADRPQNQARTKYRGIEVFTQTDPCLLEIAVEDAGKRFAANTYDEGISTETGAADGSTGPTTVTDLKDSSVNIPCAPGTTDLKIHTGYAEGKAIQLRLCALPNLPSSSAESQPGSRYYIGGANGNAIINSRASANFFELVKAAKAAGIPMRANSSFRTMEHQTALCQANADCRSGGNDFVAQPGFSNHQLGVAIDFEGLNKKTKADSCAGRAREVGNPIWDWLYVNGDKYGIKQYNKESWHWDISGLKNRCGFGT